MSDLEKSPEIFGRVLLPCMPAYALPLPGGALPLLPPPSGIVKCACAPYYWNAISKCKPSKHSTSRFKQCNSGATKGEGNIQLFCKTRTRSLGSAAFLAQVSKILAVGKWKKRDKSFMRQKKLSKVLGAEKLVLILPCPTQPIEAGWSLSANTDLWKGFLNNRNIQRMYQNHSILVLRWLLITVVIW